MKSRKSLKFLGLLIFSALIALANPSAFALPFGQPRPENLGEEHGNPLQSYQERPDILNLQPREHRGLHWNRWRRAHLESVALLLELYPTQHLYFLARDAELLYDAVRFLHRDNPAALERFHLINVNRVNMNDPHLLEYLAQEGISEQRLNADPHFQPVFIDTGFQGTIPNLIKRKFSKNLARRILTHLVASNTSGFPSMRTALFEVDPSINGRSPGQLETTVRQYETIPRFSARSHRYQWINEQWHPVSQTVITTNIVESGPPNPLISNQYQEDLLHYLTRPKTLERLTQRRALWRSLRAQWLTQSREQWQETLRSHLRNGAEIEPVVRDFLDWSYTNGRNLHPHLEDVATAVLESNIGLAREPNPNLSIHTHWLLEFPHLAKYFEYPEIYIPELLDSASPHELQSILVRFNDSEMRQVALAEIAKRIERPEIYRLAKSLLSLLANEGWNAWTIDLFKEPRVITLYPNLFHETVELAHPSFGGSLIWVLNLPHMLSSDRLDFLIRATPPNKLREYFTFFANRPDMSLRDHFLFIIEHSPVNDISIHAQQMTEGPWSADSTLYETAIDRSSPHVLRLFLDPLKVFSLDTQLRLGRKIFERATDLEYIESFADRFIQRLRSQASTPHEHLILDAYAHALTFVNPENRKEYLSQTIGMSVCTQLMVVP